MKAMQVIATLGFVLGLNINAIAEETTMEKVDTTAQKAGNSVKKVYRSAKDKTCEMIDGKMQCAGKKLKHKVENVTDEAKTKIEETKNKVD